MDQRRSIVSYDDISGASQVMPYHGPVYDNQPQHGPSRPPPAKKRKRNQNRRNQGHGQPQQQQHWDDPRRQEQQYHMSATTSALTTSASVFAPMPEEEEEGSRELTSEEIWDDSALVDAWNAATEEYETFNGPEKNWKKEPLHKSPLWYNVPPKAKSQEQKKQNLVVPEKPVEPEEDSEPLNFDTFVPNHDPSLELPELAQPPSIPGPDYASYFMPAPPGPLVSQDEAFNRALGAMYWGGYWTAMYHASKTLAQPGQVVAEEGEDEEEVEEELETWMVEGFVSTQR